jgi:chromosome segregation ATPase
MTRKHWIITISILFAAVLLYFILREPKPIDSHKDDYDRIVAENKAFKDKEAVTLKRIDSLETAGNNKDSAITSLKYELSAVRKVMDVKNVTIIKLSKEVKELSKSDTTPLGRKCDSLAEEAQNFAFLYGQYKEFSDSLVTKMNSQKVDYTTALEEQRALYDELKQKYGHLYEGYNTLYQDLRSANKTIKRERLKTKIAAILGLAAGAAAILK